MRQGLANPGVRQGSKLAARYRFGVNERQEVQLGVQAGFLHDALQGVVKAIVVNIGRPRIGRAVSIKIAQGNGLYRCIGLMRGLEQAGMKATQAEAVGGRAFGEDQYAVTLCQCRGNVLHGVLSLAALDEQTAGTGGQPADEWPCAHFRFGQKTHAR